jgi:hypothetical protein
MSSRADRYLMVYLAFVDAAFGVPFIQIFFTLPGNLLLSIPWRLQNGGCLSFRLLEDSIYS